MISGKLSDEFPPPRNIKTCSIGSGSKFLPVLGLTPTCVVNLPVGCPPKPDRDDLRNDITCQRLVNIQNREGSRKPTGRPGKTILSSFSRADPETCRKLFDEKMNKLGSFAIRLAVRFT